jgi:hypothetical protein
LGLIDILGTQVNFVSADEFDNHRRIGCERPLSEKIEVDNAFVQD